MSTVTVADLVVELPYNHHLGLKAVEGPDGSVLLPGADYLKNHVDSQHAGALFSVEPGIYLPEFGIRSEVNVFVSKGSSTVTGEIQSELVTIR